jgi:shikimate dehydrogenase
VTSAVPYAEVIGDPISHSKSPLLHGLWLRKLGVQGEYKRCLVPPAELSAYLAHRRTDPAWRGCNITIPHKVTALSMTDSVDTSASAVGATNCIIVGERGLCALNTDCVGVEASLPSGARSACIIGAGGAARAALATLKSRGAGDVRVICRDPDKAAGALAGKFPGLTFFPMAHAVQALEGAGWVINASPLGMIGQLEMPVALLEALSAAAEDAHVLEMVYAPLDTPLLVHARKLGLGISDGLTMLIGQAAEAFELFFGRPAPRQHDAELRQLLAA